MMNKIYRYPAHDVDSFVIASPALLDAMIVGDWKAIRREGVIFTRDLAEAGFSSFVCDMPEEKIFFVQAADHEITEEEAATLDAWFARAGIHVSDVAYGSDLHKSWLAYVQD